MGGGVHGRGWHAWQGACMAGGHAWQGGMHGRRACMAGGMHHKGHASQGACVAVGGMHGRGHVWWILRGAVKERALHILLECILVIHAFNLFLSSIFTIIHCFYLLSW